MRIWKSHPLFSLVNGYLVDSPQPPKTSYLWNFGSLLGFCLVIQIVTGVTLAMHYNPSVLEAFNSVEHIIRNVNNGLLTRYLLWNTVSAFLLLVYVCVGSLIDLDTYLIMFIVSHKPCFYHFFISNNIMPHPLILIIYLFICGNCILSIRLLKGKKISTNFWIIFQIIMLLCAAFTCMFEWEATEELCKYIPLAIISSSSIICVFGFVTIRDVESMATICLSGVNPFTSMTGQQLNNYITFVTREQARVLNYLNRPNAQDYDSEAMLKTLVRMEVVRGNIHAARGKRPRRTIAQDYIYNNTINPTF